MNKTNLYVVAAFWVKDVFEERTQAFWNPVSLRNPIFLRK